MKFVGLVLTAALGTLLPSAQTRPVNSDQWVQLSPGIKVRHAHVGRGRVLEYRASNPEASEQLNAFLVAEHKGTLPLVRTGAPHLRASALGSCTDTMYAGAGGSSAGGSIRVSCPDGVNIQATIQVQPAVGSGVPSGWENYSGTTTLYAVYSRQCTPTSPQDPECKNSIRGEDLNNWSAWTSWSADNGESDYQMFCGETNYSCGG